MSHSTMSDSTTDSDSSEDESFYSYLPELDLELGLDLDQEDPNPEDEEVDRDRTLNEIHEYSEKRVSVVHQNEGDGLAAWLMSHAFKHGSRHNENFRQILKETLNIDLHRYLMSSPVAGMILMRAVRMNRPDVIQIMLDYGADVNMMLHGETMLHNAVKQPSESMIRFLLSKPGVDKDISNTANQTPVMIATINGYPRCLKILLDARCGIFKTDKDGNTALHLPFVSQKSNSKILTCLRLLMLYGADINSRDGRGRTCLQKAVESGCHCLVGWLILHNCNLQVTLSNSPVILSSSSFLQAHSVNKETPFFLALHRADRVLAEGLMACGCDFRRYRWMLQHCRPYSLLSDSFSQALSNVQSLQVLCRKTVRSHLSTNILKEVKQLGLPPYVQRFTLCCEELRTLGLDCVGNL